MKKVLIVEDDRFFAAYLAELLMDYNLETEITDSTQNALKHDLGQLKAAIIDVMLPNDPNESGIVNGETRGGFLSGVAVARRFRKTSPDFPIILFSSGIAGGEGKKWASANQIPYFLKSEGAEKIVSSLRKFGLLPEQRLRAFIVHGRDEQSLLELKDYLQNTLKMDETISLRDQPGCGKTVIENFEKYANRADYVFALLTPDDIATPADSPDDEKRRARQNVIFELGFFYTSHPDTPLLRNNPRYD